MAKEQHAESLKQLRDGMHLGCLQRRATDDA
jgi:hypothetical protein